MKGTAASIAKISARFDELEVNYKHLSSSITNLEGKVDKRMGEQDIKMDEYNERINDLYEKVKTLETTGGMANIDPGHVYVTKEISEKASCMNAIYVKGAPSFNEAKKALEFLVEGLTTIETTNLEPYYKKLPKPNGGEETKRKETSNEKDFEKEIGGSGSTSTPAAANKKQARSYVGLKATLPKPISKW